MLIYLDGFIFDIDIPPGITLFSSCTIFRVFLSSGYGMLVKGDEEGGVERREEAGV